LYQFTKCAIKLAVVIIVGYHCYQLHSKQFLPRITVEQNVLPII
jgi:hypothetical protein